MGGWGQFQWGPIVQHLGIGFEDLGGRSVLGGRIAQHLSREPVQEEVLRSGLGLAFQDEPLLGVVLNCALCCALRFSLVRNLQ